jgi:hypothetical protein
MLRLLFWALSFLLGSALKRILIGAGLALLSSQAIQALIDTYINKALNGMSFGGSSAIMFLGLSGADVAISILIGALMARAFIEASKIGLRKITS